MSNLELSPPQTPLPEKQAEQIPDQPREFVVQFWGVRNLIASPSNHTKRYGGNTACVSMQIGDKRLVFDGGTGLRCLGKSWLESQDSLEAHFFFTNSQTSRIQGFPFFAPAFIPKNKFQIYGAAATNGASIKQCLCDQMLLPHFPYPLLVMQSELQFHNFMAGKIVNIDDVTITTELINQTQKSIGYRVNWQNYNVAYVTDLQKLPNQVERERIIKLIADVDLLIANSTNPATFHQTEQEHKSHWQTAVELAYAANVKQLIISQHHPDDHDDFLDQVQTEINSVFSDALVAHEGLVLNVIE